MLSWASSAACSREGEREGAMLDAKSGDLVVKRQGLREDVAASRVLQCFFQTREEAGRALRRERRQASRKLSSVTVTRGYWSRVWCADRPWVGAARGEGSWVRGSARAARRGWWIGLDPGNCQRLLLGTLATRFILDGGSCLSLGPCVVVRSARSEGEG